MNNDLLFWTDILSDHAMFQSNAFSHSEENYITEAERFNQIFKRYHQTILSQKTADLHALENDTINFINFKKTIIHNLLHHNILINFSPSFVNHMVNEADEFLNILRMGRCPLEKPPHYIKTWLADASGHAVTLSSFLDLAETTTINHAQFYKDTFDKLEKKASEISMIGENLKAKINPELLKEETIEILNEFIKFCMTIGEQLDKKKIMSTGTMSSAITNHFIKEHRYVINKLETCL